MRPTSARSLRGKVALIGVGETDYYKHGMSPHSEFKLALMAIMNACANEDVGTAEVSHMVQTDPALSGRLLERANAATQGGRPVASQALHLDRISSPVLASNVSYG